MSFDNPWWLLAAIPVLGSRLADCPQGRQDGSQRASIVRRPGCGWPPFPCWSCAAAQPILTRAVDDRSVLFLLDRSASISAEAAADQEAVLSLGAGGKPGPTPKPRWRCSDATPGSTRPSPAAGSRGRFGPSPTTRPPTWQVPWRRQRR